MKVEFKALLIITIIIVFFIIGYFGMSLFFEQDEKEIDIYIEELYNKIYEDLSDDLNQMVEMTYESYIEKYKIEESKVSNYLVYTPVINVKSDEIAIIKVKDNKYIDDIKYKLDIRADNIINEFEGYIEQEYIKAKNYEIFNKDNYVFLIISDNLDQIKSIIEEEFKN